MEDNAELESFRQQWREEVASRGKQAQQAKPSKPSVQFEPRGERFPPIRHEASQRDEEEEEEEEEKTGAEEPHDVSSQPEIVAQVDQLSLDTTEDDGFDQREPQKEPDSALEHFERAVEKEAEGSLGDSLQHYRKAYRVCLCNLFEGFMLMLAHHSWIRASTRLIATSILRMHGKRALYRPCIP